MRIQSNDHSINVISSQLASMSRQTCTLRLAKYMFDSWMQNRMKGSLGTLTHIGGGFLPSGESLLKTRRLIITRSLSRKVVQRTRKPITRQTRYKAFSLCHRPIFRHSDSRGPSGDTPDAKNLLFSNYCDPMTNEPFFYHFMSDY